MSDKSGGDSQGVGAKPGRGKKASLLLAGAAAIALLLGGGYYAWQHNDTAPSEIASAENVASPAQSTEADATDVTTDKVATPAETTVAAAPISQAPAKKTSAVAKVPEETIGISRVSARANQTDELVINGKRRPVWRYTPTAARLAEYYPSFALERGREGEARLHCIIGERGKLDCERVSETPAKAGFGAAALQVARRFRHADHLANGRDAIGTPLNLRVVFRMAEDERRF